MTWEPATVELETPLAEVARRMLAYGVRHLPVVVGVLQPKRLPANTAVLVLQRRVLPRPAGHLITPD